MNWPVGTFSLIVGAITMIYGGGAEKPYAFALGAVAVVTAHLIRIIKALEK